MITIIDRNNLKFLTIQRILSEKKASLQWKINGDNSDETTLKRLMQSFSIDVSNLCSFMPQDSVGKFSQYTPKEILINTLKSIKSEDKNGSLHDEQIRLSAEQDGKIRKEAELKQCKADISLLQRQIDGIRGDVEKMNRRKVYEQDIKSYGTMLQVVKCNEAKEKLSAKKDAYDKFMENIETERVKLAPLESAVRSSSVEHTGFEAALRDCTQRSRSHMNTSHNLQEETKSISAELDNNVHFYENYDRDISSLRLSVERIQSQIVDLEGEHENSRPQVHAKNSEVNEINGSILRKDREIAKIKQDIQSLYSASDECDRMITSMEAKLARQVDFKSQLKEKIIQNADQYRHDLMSTLNFISSNESQWRGEVLGPVGMHIECQSQVATAIIERLIPKNILTLTFLVADEEDAFALKRFRQQQKLKINIVTMNAKDASYPQYSSGDRESLRRLGISNVITDLFECPNIVLRYLCTFYSLNRILYTQDTHFDPSDGLVTFCTERRQDIFSVFVNHGVSQNVSSSSSSYQGNRNGNTPKSSSLLQYFGRKSRYSSQFSIASYAVQNKGILIHPQELNSMNMDQVEALKSQVASKREEKVDLRKSQDKFQLEIQSLESSRDELKSRKASLIQQIKVLEGRRYELSQKQREKQNLESQIDAKQRDYQQHRHLVRQLLDKFFISSEQLLQEEQLRVRIGIERNVLSIRKAELKGKLGENQQALARAKSAISALEDDAKELERELEPLQRELTMEMRELEKAKEELGGENQLITFYEDCCQRFPERDRASIEARMEELQFAMERCISNPTVLRRFEEWTKSLAEKEEECCQLERDCQELGSSLDLSSYHWLDTVRTLAIRLNELFSRYMSELNFRGEVALVEKGAFSDFEIQLKVAFRAEGMIVDLSGFRHSGGERSVSTIMYLMALQELISSPFRIVDEINQGMDEVNERLVMQRVVQSCLASPESPQYFLVSPKLLPGLRALEEEGVTVLIVCNGPGALPQWNLSQYIASVQERVSKKRKRLSL